MKRILTALIFCFPVCFLFASPQVEKRANTLVQRTSNEAQVIDQMKRKMKRAFHPTRVIRVKGDVSSLNIDCQQVQQVIHDELFSRIPSRQFLYNTLMLCNYHPDTHLAEQFVIDSYIDPITDNDEMTLQKLEKEFKGYEFFGIPIQIERAKGVVVSLEMNAGREDRNKNDPRILRFRRDHKSLYFPSNYELTQHLIADIHRRFYSADRNKILPFIETWFYQGIKNAYANLLRHVNLMELMPERIFLMTDGEPIFASRMHMYYSHHCQRSESGVCLD